MENIEVKIYLLIDPITEEIRYIGRTKNTLSIRLSGHLSKANSRVFKTHKDNWILNLKNKKLKPIIKLLKISNRLDRKLFRRTKFN